MQVTIPPSPQANILSPTTIGVGTYAGPRSSLYATDPAFPPLLEPGVTATACLVPFPWPATWNINPEASTGEATVRTEKIPGTSQFISPVLGFKLVMP